MQIAREHIVPLLFACFFLTGIIHANGSFDPYPNTDIAPEFALADLDNKRHRLSEYRGKVVLVNFWASWCVPCLREMPGMQRMADSLRDQAFEILAINVAEQQHRVQEFLNSMDISLTVLLDSDGSTLKAWQVRGLPTSFLIDAEGRIRYRVVGPIDWDSDEVLATIDKLLPDIQ